jgi:hypothetical protein
MNRYRNWVGALHWGQLLLLVPTLLLAGVIVGVAAIGTTEEIQGVASVEFTRVSAALVSARIDSINRTRDGRPSIIDPDLNNRVRRAAAQKKRARSNAAWVAGAGVFGWALAWLTAFSSLWWWFGTRAKPRGTA